MHTTMGNSSSVLGRPPPLLMTVIDDLGGDNSNNNNNSQASSSSSFSSSSSSSCLPSSLQGQDDAGSSSSSSTTRQPPRSQLAALIREAIRNQDFDALPVLLCNEFDVLWELDYSGSTCMHFASYFMSLTCQFPTTTTTTIATGNLSREITTSLSTTGTTVQPTENDASTTTTSSGRRQLNENNAEVATTGGSNNTNDASTTRRQRLLPPPSQPMVDWWRWILEAAATAAAPAPEEEEENNKDESGNKNGVASSLRSRREQRRTRVSSPCCFVHSSRLPPPPPLLRSSTATPSCWPDKRRRRTSRHGRRRGGFLQAVNNRGQTVFDVFFQVWFKPHYSFRNEFPSILLLPRAIEALVNDKRDGTTSRSLRNRLLHWIQHDLPRESAATTTTATTINNHTHHLNNSSNFHCPQGGEERAQQQQQQQQQQENAAPVDIDSDNEENQQHNHNDDTSDNDDEELFIILTRFWKSLETLCRVSLFGKVGYNKSNHHQDDSWNVVHFLASLSFVPAPVAKLAVALYPHQVRQYDFNGRLPLHCWADSNCYRDERSAMLQVLIKEYPQALLLPERQQQLVGSKRDADDTDETNDDSDSDDDSPEERRHGGRLPLHMAAASSRPLSEVKQLWRANPEALAVPAPYRCANHNHDDGYGLPCFCLLAVDARQKEQEALTRILASYGVLGTLTTSSITDVHAERLRLQRLTAIYEALRACPSAIPSAQRQPSPTSPPTLLAKRESFFSWNHGGNHWSMIPRSFGKLFQGDCCRPPTINDDHT